MAKARLLHNGDRVDYTPAADVAAGSIVVVNGLVKGVATFDIAASKQGSLARFGVFSCQKVNGVIADEAPLHFDADGDPQGGDAGTGALTTDHTKGPFVGRCVKAAASADKTVEFRLEAPAPHAQGAAVADLGQTISDPPTQAEVQALTDKVDALLAVLRTAGLIAT